MCKRRADLARLEAADWKHLVIEGSEAEGAAILEFPSFEEAKAWYYSPAYQDAVKHRLRGGTYRGMIVEGVSEARNKFIEEGR